MAYDYQNTNRYFAQIADDVKDIAEEELLSLGAVDTSPAYRGIYFTADTRALYTINFHAHLIHRILAPLTTFNCHSDKYLYRKGSEIAWEDFLTPERTFAVFATVSHSAIRHSKFAALRLKDAVVDRFRDRTGERPSIDTREPDVWINLHIQNNKATISFDTSGGSLHRRGYRKAGMEAPMIETLAAAIIRYAGWDGSVPLYDPFCGSGTLLCEAYLYASRTPPGLLRKTFGFEKLPDFDASLCRQIREAGMRQVTPVSKGLIAGSDVSSEAVDSARRNCAVIDTNGVIEIARKDVFHSEGIAEKAIICNPPYGVRMGKNDDLAGFYKTYGDFLKQRCTGSTACIYFGERAHMKQLGLRPSWKKPLSNGGLEGCLAMYALY